MYKQRKTTKNYSYNKFSRKHNKFVSHANCFLAKKLNNEYGYLYMYVNIATVATVIGSIQSAASGSLSSGVISDAGVIIDTPLVSGEHFFKIRST